MALDIDVKIKLSEPVGALDYNYPLILVIDGDEITDKPYVECRKLEDVVNAGYADTTHTYEAVKLIFEQDNAPTRVSIKNCATSDELNTLKEYIDRPWRQLIVISEASPNVDIATVKAISDYMETKKKIYIARVLSVDDISTLTATNNRTAVFVYPTETVYAPEASVCGATVGQIEGSITYKNIILNSLEDPKYTDEQIENIHQAGGFTCVTKAGDLVTTEGKSISGEFIDLIDCQDYATNRIGYNIQKVLNTNKKVPYDNVGISLLETATVDALQEAFNNGIITTDASGNPAYSVEFALREQTTEEDRKKRIYPYGKFSFTISGAIHHVEISGEIEF